MNPGSNELTKDSSPLGKILFKHGRHHARFHYETNAITNSTSGQAVQYRPKDMASMVSVGESPKAAQIGSLALLALRRTGSLGWGGLSQPKELGLPEGKESGTSNCQA